MHASDRNHAVDLLRGISVVGMVFAHGIRCIAIGQRPTWTEWILGLEPLIQATFLYLLGYSAAMAKLARPAGWAWRQIKRAGLLWVISAAMTLIERGWSSPGLVVWGGFLGLAARTLLVLAVLQLAHSQWGPWLGLLVVWGISYGAELSEFHRIWLNMGSGPLLPLMPVAILGFLHNQISHWIKRASLVLAAGVLLYMGWDWLARTGRDSFLVGGVYYYILHTTLALVLGLLVMSALHFTEMTQPKALPILSQLGQRPLLAYLIHLGLLGVVRLSFGFLDAFWTLLLPLSVLALTTMLLYLAPLRIRSSA